MQIYHNPRCTKSRETLQILKDKKIDHEIVLYLNTPPNSKQLEDIIKKLGIKAHELIRKTEKVFKEQFKGKDLSEEEWVTAMVEYPKLIERPIVISENKAVIGRPPTNVLQLLSKPNKTQIIAESKKWVENMVIGLNLCPFASFPYDSDLVRFTVIRSNSMAEWIQSIYKEAHILQESPATKISNTLLIFSNGLEDFQDFLDLVEMAQDTLEDQRLEKVIQLASFHPDYQFAGTSLHDVSNYTNKSPYPMLHLLRVEEVSKAIDVHENTELIPEENQVKLKEMGLSAIKKQLSK